MPVPEPDADSKLNVEQALPAMYVGVLAREFPVRLLNCSATGCLFETNTHVAVGTIASLSVVIEGQEFVDDVHVVRSQSIRGASALFHVGARFLWTAPAVRRTLRYALGHARITSGQEDVVQPLHPSAR